MRADSHLFIVEFSSDFECKQGINREVLWIRLGDLQTQVHFEAVIAAALPAVTVHPRPVQDALPANAGHRTKMTPAR